MSVGMVGILVGERDVIGACAGVCGKKKRIGGQLVLLDAGREMGQSCVCEEKTGEEGKAMQSASLMVLNAKNSLGEAEAVWVAVVRQT